MKLHLGCGLDLRPGFENLDARSGWRFESGLGAYRDGSVEGITISHALMYVAGEDWPRVIAEFIRVLEPSGVLRITEDDCETDGSPRRLNPWPGARCLTGPAMARRFLQSAGFTVYDVGSGSTFFSDNTLLIAHREGKTPPYVFYLEGIKPRV